MSMIGYSSYSPAKHALRGARRDFIPETPLYVIGQALRKHYGPNYFSTRCPSTFSSRGRYTVLDISRRIRPNQKLLSRLRRVTMACNPTKLHWLYFKVRRCVFDCATGTYREIGVEHGYFHISGDFVGNLFRSATRGASPHNNVMTDIIYTFIGWVCAPPYLTSILVFSNMCGLDWSYIMAPGGRRVYSGTSGWARGTSGATGLLWTEKYWRLGADKQSSELVLILLRSRDYKAQVANERYRKMSERSEALKSTGHL